MPRKKREVCSTKGCRKTVASDNLCEECLAAVEFANDAQLMEAYEAECWGRLYAEVTSHRLKAQLLAYKQKELQAEFDRKVEDLRKRYNEQFAEFERDRCKSLAEAKQCHEHYSSFTDELCSKYNVERKYAVLDVESREIREEKPNDQ